MPKYVIEIHRVGDGVSVDVRRWDKRGLTDEDVALLTEVLDFEGMTRAEAYGPGGMVAVDITPPPGDPNAN